MKYIMIFLIFLFIKSDHRIGIGTIYADRFENRFMANGERFSQHKMVAASNFYKLGTKVKVINLKNNKEVTVKICDRMAVWTEKKGRIIDLSKSAAKEIGFTDGLLRVRVETI